MLLVHAQVLREGLPVLLHAETRGVRRDVLHPRADLCQDQSRLRRGGLYAAPAKLQVRALARDLRRGGFVRVCEGRVPGRVRLHRRICRHGRVHVLPAVMRAVAPINETVRARR